VTAPLTETERAVVREIVRIAREELGFEPAAFTSADPGEGPARGAGGPADAVLAASLDSLQLLSLVVAVEDRFRIVLAEEDAAGTRTLEDLARLVTARAQRALLPPAPGETTQERAP
jgi:acyl carrier protein